MTYRSSDFNDDVVAEMARMNRAQAPSRAGTKTGCANARSLLYRNAERFPAETCSKLKLITAEIRKSPMEDLTTGLVACRDMLVHQVSGGALS
jgi:hypothetical protein